MDSSHVHGQFAQHGTKKVGVGRSGSFRKVGTEWELFQQGSKSEHSMACANSCAPTSYQEACTLADAQWCHLMRS